MKDQKLNAKELINNYKPSSIDRLFAICVYGREINSAAAFRCINKRLGRTPIENKKETCKRLDQEFKSIEVNNYSFKDFKLIYTPDTNVASIS